MNSLNNIFSIEIYFYDEYYNKFILEYFIYSYIYICYFNYFFKRIFFNYKMISNLKLGIGDWGLGPIPNPQSPIPNPQSP